MQPGGPKDPTQRRSAAGRREKKVGLDKLDTTFYASLVNTDVQDSLF